MTTTAAARGCGSRRSHESVLRSPISVVTSYSNREAAAALPGPGGGANGADVPGRTAGPRGPGGPAARSDRPGPVRCDRSAPPPANRRAAAGVPGALPATPAGTPVPRGNVNDI